MTTLGRSELTLPPWRAEPYRLWSLLDMQILVASKLVEAQHNLTILGQVSLDSEMDGNKALEDGDVDHFKSRLDPFRHNCVELGLDLTVDQIDRIYKELDTEVVFPHRAFWMLEALSDRYRDELARTLCFFVPRDRANFWQDDQPFGQAVYERFPEAVDDVVEAGRCLALARGTASVFHLMRVVERGLKAVAAEMGIPFALTWESYLKQIKTRVEKPYADMDEYAKKHHVFISEVGAHIADMKRAWRNPTMHVTGTYTLERAEDVYGAVKGFMRHLAEGLPDSRQPA